MSKNTKSPITPIVVDQPVGELPSISPLTFPLVGNLQQAIHKLRDLKSQVIRTKTGDAEQQGLEGFIRNELYNHAAELLGSWVVLQHEFIPLVQGVKGLLSRVAHVQAEEKAELEARRVQSTQPQ